MYPLVVSSPQGFALLVVDQQNCGLLFLFLLLLLIAILLYRLLH
uniref:E5 n=1 Tax=Human papillomavirus type 61 TaxID=37116 RepID=A0A159DSB5_HPV61|nr:E5 beta [Human papillomavirus type 61]ARQ82630.1 E5 [Human papillomavirus type 61]WBM83719.1 E5 BETA protein [Alphapapillomavirus 3]WBM83813.1 E5 BETA protein [Alphapapillomavirus 3]WBM83936.1 E5 BETA protein [Alphapapillomavirus 3]